MTPDQLSQLSPEEKRVRIAEFCGIKAKGYFSKIVWVYGGEMHKHPPDYLNDLNAMAQAESKLSDEQHTTFRNNLWKAIGAEYCVPYQDTGEFHRRWISATATQRADAMLMAI